MLELSDDTRLGLISAFFRAWLRFCRRTADFEVKGAERLNERLFRDRRGAIIALWHNRLVWCAKWAQEEVVGAGRPLTVLVSASRDGEIATRVSEDMGLDVARGSSSRRGLSGMREVLRSARHDPLLAFVVDGPRGPVYQSKRGVLEAARLTGFPIFPYSFSCDRSILLGSWDRMVVPAPFSTVTVEIGEPLSISRRATEEELNSAQRMLDQRLNDLTEALDQESGLYDHSFGIGKARQQKRPRP